MQSVHLYELDIDTLYGSLLTVIDNAGWDSYKNMDATALAGLAHMAGDIDGLRTSMIWLPRGAEPQRLSDMIEFLHDYGVEDVAAMLTTEHIDSFMEVHDLVSSVGVDMDDHYYAALLTRVLIDRENEPRITSIVRDRGAISMEAIDDLLADMTVLPPALASGVL